MGNGNEDQRNTQIGRYPDSVSVEGKKQKTPIRPQTLELSVDLPGNTGVEAIVKQDVTGDGVPDNEQSIVAEDGKHEYDLNEFELNGYQVWTEFVLKSKDGMNTASISSFKLTGDKPE